jgi:hypothetical protein
MEGKRKGERGAGYNNRGKVQPNDDIDNSKERGFQRSRLTC